MAWVAVNKDKSEFIYSQEPERRNDSWSLPVDQDYCIKGDNFELPKGSIYKLTGKNLSWNDNPIEIK